MREVTRHGDFEVATAPDARGGWMAWAKMGKLSGDSPITEPGEHVWFEFGQSREEARQKLLTELGLAL